MANTSLTVVLPGLAGIVQQKINDTVLPKVYKKIAKKAHFKASDATLTRLLFNCFSETDIVSNDLPYAQLLDDKTPTLCGTPSYLHADRDRLLLFADPQPLTEQECTELIEELQALFVEFDAKLVCHSSGELLVQLKTLPDLSFSALTDVNGQSVTDYLPQGKDKIAWVRLWSEIQMKLYNSAFNQRREDAGKHPINSLWFWGMGEFKVKHNYWQNVQGRNATLEQLSLAASAPFTKSDIWSVDSLVQGKNLWVLDELNLEADWQQQLEQWEEAILKPAWLHCRKAKIHSLALHIPNFGNYTLTPFDCWKFW